MTATMAPKTFSFQAEIKQLLHLLSHSLYQHRDIALRELISNASDALNKLRHIQLTDEQYRDDQPLEIRLVFDRAAKTLTVQDNGIGLTHDELVENLGTIAHSGSREFLAKLAQAHSDQPAAGGTGDVSLIGQFGVGFYSAFMLAERVEVITRSYRESTGWLWQSEGSGQFSIQPLDETVPRGAQVRLHLKADAEEFLDPQRVREIIRRYSTFVAYPIYVDGERVNEQRPIWVEPRNQVTLEQYVEFFRWLSHRTSESPLWHLHLAADSPLQFQAILYCPEKNYELLGLGRLEHGLHLCAKRILVQDDCKELLPDYLRFVYGLVDSADLPLNVSRETLQDQQLLPKLRKVLTRKVLDYLHQLGQEDPPRYRRFYEEFGSILRTGVHTDFEQREKIAGLMRFHSTRDADPEALVSLDDYISRMVEGQRQIYYLTALHPEAAAQHPRLEAFRERGLEVLLLADPVDEFALQHLGTYQEKALVSVDSADVEWPAEASKSEGEGWPRGWNRVQELFRGALAEWVADVKPSSRLGRATAALVNPAGGYSRTLQHVLQQTVKDYRPQKPVLEVNPQAALIHRLCELSVNPEHDEFIRECGRHVYAVTTLQDGVPERPQEIAATMLRLMEEVARHKSSIIH
ncbi:MAG: chaperone protein HtpG [Planctomycetaceae bacterium]|nr:MAG: chaperone protein HtpG [Planctomycetaceae bacterium]